MNVLTNLLLAGTSTPLTVSNEIGPEGHKLIWFFLSIVLLGLIVYGYVRRNKSTGWKKNIFRKRSKITVQLKKDRVYRPRYLEVTVINNGPTDVDLGAPMLILKGMWYSRKFKLKGNGNNWFYPLYLMKGQVHTLNIDLQRFYGFDRTLKRMPKARVVVNDVNGRRLASTQVLLRQTLF